MLAKFCRTCPANSLLEQSQCKCIIITHLYDVSTVHHQGDPAKNAHAQHFMANDNLLLLILKAFAKFICSIHPTQEMLDVFSLCFFTLNNGSPSVLSIVNNPSAQRWTWWLPTSLPSLCHLSGQCGKVLVCWMVGNAWR